MKKLLLIALFTALISSLSTADAADARKDCAELQTEIAAKLEAKGVRHYRLEIVAPEALGEARQVGSCNGGTQRIAYARLPAPAAEAGLASATESR